MRGLDAPAHATRGPGATARATRGPDALDRVTRGSDALTRATRGPDVSIVPHAASASRFTEPPWCTTDDIQPPRRVIGLPPRRRGS
jgi:hypothetical protein